MSSGSSDTSSSSMSTQTMILLLIAVVVIAAVCWYMFVMKATRAAPTGPTPQSVGQLIDRYNMLVRNPRFTDVMLRPARDALEKDLPANFISIITQLPDNFRMAAGSALNEVERIMAGPLSLDTQRVLATEHNNAIAALQAKSEADLNKAIDTLRRTGRPRPPTPARQ